jgi:hypothetical protein
MSALLNGFSATASARTPNKLGSMIRQPHSSGSHSMALRAQLLFISAFAGLLLSACAQTGPVEFSASGANAPMLNPASDMDFGPMDRTIAQCKVVSKNAGADQCSKVRAYESCMKSKGYITVLGPENPKGCGDPEWEKEVRKWLQ